MAETMCETWNVPAGGADPLIGGPPPLDRPLRILLLEDSDLDAELAAAALEQGGLRVEVIRTSDAESFADGLADPALDLILSDYALPTYDGIRALKLARERRPELPFLFLSGALGEDRAVDSLQRGATDYVLKQRLERLAPAVRRALELSAERRERRAAELKLSDTEARYRLLVEEVRDYAIIFTDPAGIVQTWNPAATRILGWSTEEMTGQPLARIFTPEDRDARVPDLELATARARGRAPDERWLLRKDGSRIFASGVLTALRAPSGELTGFVKIVQDITERKRADEERARLLESEREAREMAESAGRAKDEFLATLSHELRTPLNAVLGWATLLRNGSRDPDELDEGLEIIERNARMQAKLIEDILDISRVISGKLRLDVSRVCVAGVIQEAVEAVSLAAQTKGINLRLHLDETLHVLGDAGRLQQVVWNLLANAVKFTSTGKDVTVLARRAENAAEIIVADGGMGIAPDFLPHVFERFRQADSSSRRQHGGLGLGLAIVRHLVELHGGRVEARSEGLGKGAEFRILLPLEVSDIVRNEEPPVQLNDDLWSQPGPVGLGGAIGAGNSLEGINVLVVEDEADVRRLMVAVLGVYGARVQTAASVEEGLALFHQQRPDVLLSDIGMPGQDGYELIRRIRQFERENPHQRRLPAAAITAYAAATDRAKAFEAGFDRHVVKPLKAPQLVEVISGLVKG